MPEETLQSPVNNEFLKYVLGFAYVLYGKKFGTLPQERYEDFAYLVNTLIQSGKIFGIDQNRTVTGDFCLQSLHQNPTTYRGLSPENAWSQCCEWGVDVLVAETLNHIMEIQRASEFEHGLDEIDEMFSPPRPNISLFIKELPTPEAHRERNEEMGIPNQEDDESPVIYEDTVQSAGVQTFSSGNVTPVANPNPYSNESRGMETLNSGFGVLPVANPNFRRRRRE